MEAGKKELPADELPPHHQQSPSPSLPAPYGWQLDCMEVESGAPTACPRTMPRPGHIQRSPDAENAMNPLPNNEMVSPPYPPLYLECQQAHHTPGTAGHGVDFGQQGKVNQELFVSPSEQDAGCTTDLQENPVGSNLPSNRSPSFQMDPEVERAAAMVAGGPRDLAAMQTPGTKAAPYPLSPQQVLSPNPMNAALQMPTPPRPSLGKIGPLMSFNSDWFSFNQPMPPVEAEPFPTPGDAHRFNSDLQQQAGGYQQEFTPQLQDVFPAGPHSPKQSPATSKMGPSKEPEHQIQTESMFNPFIQTPKTDEGCSSPDPPQMPIGFETLGQSVTNISDQSSGTTSFPEPPNTHKTDPTLNEAWGLFQPASCVNFPQPDVRTEQPIPISPISNHKSSAPPRKITSDQPQGEPSTSGHTENDCTEPKEIKLMPHPTLR